MAAPARADARRVDAPRFLWRPARVGRRAGAAYPLHPRRGTTWAPQRSGTSATLYHIDFRNEDDGWAVGERGTILRTTDGGQTWSPVKAPVRSTLLSVKFASDKDGWIVGRGGVILRSEDGGQTWAPQPGNRTRENLYALFVEKKNGWAVGGNGVVMQYER